MRIYDTFLFGGELDMLETRLYELQDAPVYKHVIVEAATTFQGRHKGLVFPDHRERFASWKDRLRYVIADPGGGDAWAREAASREETGKGLQDARAGDVIIHGDVDEILTAAAIRRLGGIAGPVKFTQRCAVFAVDWLLPWPWTAPSAMRAGQVPSFTQLRMSGWADAGDGGWHLSWMGGPDAIDRKVNSFSHTEMLAEITAGNQAGKYYERGLFWGHGQGETQLLAVDVDETWPRWVHERKCPQVWFRPRGEL